MEVERWDTERDGPLSESAMREKLKQRGYSVSYYVYSPGTQFPDHIHDFDKIDGVIAGRFRMTIQGRGVILEAGDCLAIPRGAVHSAEVLGDEPVVCLDAVRR